MSKTPLFRPFDGRYLIQPIEEGETTKHLGEYEITTPKDIHEKPARGTVIVAAKSGATFARPGDVVLFGKYSGYEQEFDGTKYLILQESELLGEDLSPKS